MYGVRLRARLTKMRLDLELADLYRLTDDLAALDFLLKLMFRADVVDHSSGVVKGEHDEHTREEDNTTLEQAEASRGEGVHLNGLVVVRWLSMVVECSRAESARVYRDGGGSLRGSGNNSSSGRGKHLYIQYFR